LHRATGETTKLIERGHVPTRDRLRSSRGLKTLRNGQRFLEGFECLRALRGGHIRLTDLLPVFSTAARPRDRVRTVAAAALVLGMRTEATDTSAVDPPWELLPAWVPVRRIRHLSRNLLAAPHNVADPDGTIAPCTFYD
jgi:hypothetical protein